MSSPQGRMKHLVCPLASETLENKAKNSQKNKKKKSDPSAQAQEEAWGEACVLSLAGMGGGRA